VTAQVQLRAELRQVASMTNIGAPLGLGRVTPSVDPERVAQNWVWQAPHVEMLHVMSGLLDSARDGLAGHASMVARIARGVAERIGLPRDAVLSVGMAGLLHDAGKPTAWHLTALSVVEFEAYRCMAEQYASMPRQLFSAAQLPELSLAAMDGMYERFSGGGLPGGASGQQIPVEARILAAADTYADLVANASNAYQRVLSSEEALAVLGAHAPAVFDPDVVTVLQAATGGEGILDELLDQRHVLLLIDPDPQATVALRLKLSEYGFETQLVRSIDAARRALDGREFAAVLCELDVETQADGLDFLESLTDRDPAMAWLYLSGRHAPEDVRRAFALGADDIVAKPAQPDLLCPKIEQMVERRATGRPSSGVAGSLTQLSLPDLVQVLWHSRRTCLLSVTFDAGQGAIHIVKGRVVDAAWQQLRGEEAFLALVALGDDGRFAVDPHAPAPADQPITADPEQLLLRAMQRLDERA
jgi:response regulator RpfG family c-di-GMP phosphodiesterase